MANPVVYITTYGGTNYRTNVPEMILSGTVTADTPVSMFVNGSPSPGLMVSNGSWSFTATLAPGDNVYSFSATDTLGKTSSATVIVVTLVPIAGLGVVASAPTGITAESFIDQVTLSWAGNTNIYSSPRESSVILRGDVPVAISNSGYVPPSSLAVMSSDLIYYNRSVYQQGTDYLILAPETVDGPTKIQRVSTGTIPDGATLFISYQLEKIDANIIGYNVYASDTPAGGLSGYVRLNSSLIPSSDFSSVKEEIVSSTTKVTEANNVRTRVTTEGIRRLPVYSYPITNFNFVKRLSKDLTTYIVVTAVAFDPTDRSEVESAYSQEVAASPLSINTQIRSVAPRSRQDIAVDYIKAALPLQPNLDIKPTTITRDIHIDPPSNEMEKMYFVLDFINKSQSFITLMDIDDPDSTGSSDPSTPYKIALATAFGLPSIAEVQGMIDRAFDTLAANVGAFRGPAQSATGEVLLYSASRPTTALTVPIGTQFNASTPSGLISFLTLSALNVSVDQLESYFNPLSRRYEFLIPIIAQNPGSSGMVDAGAIKSGGPAGFTVTNPSPTEFGVDKEPNRHLAERAMISVIGSDSGTIGGYLKIALASQGVLRVGYQTAGSPYMLRDYDRSSGKNVGGKVDLYIQGSRPAIAEDTFGLTFPSVRDELAAVSNTVLYTVASSNPRVSITSPITTVSRVSNLTKGQDYVLTGITTLGNLITLDSTNTVNMRIGIDPTDLIKIDYSFREVNVHTLKHQPVSRIISIVGDLSGDLSSNYDLYTLEDPLHKGNSAYAANSLAIRFTQDPVTGKRKPVDALQAYSEAISLAGTNIVTLSRLGIDPNSIVVSSNDPNPSTKVIYRSNTDYEIFGTESSDSFIRISRIINSNIPDGATVIVSYEGGENIKVAYEYNSIIEAVQGNINEKEYATADVLAKEAIPVYVDIVAEIALAPNTNQSDLDVRIRTAIGRFFSKLRIGDSIFQSDMISLIENNRGVKYCKVPLTKMTRSDNSLAVMDTALITEWDLYDNNYYRSYISKTGNGDRSALTFTTSDGGGRILPLGSNSGNRERFVGVYLNNQLYPSVASPGDVAKNRGTSYIKVDPSANGSPIARVVISPYGAEPITTSKSLTATYYVIGESGAKDIAINSFEYLVLGNLTLTYKVVA